MTPEEKSMLERALKMAEENNAILHGMRRMARIGTVARILYWVILIGLSVGAFYFLQPYFDSFRSVVDSAEEAIQSVTGTTSEVQNETRSSRTPLNLSPR